MKIALQRKYENTQRLNEARVCTGAQSQKEIPFPVVYTRIICYKHTAKLKHILTSPTRAHTHTEERRRSINHPLYKLTRMAKGITNDACGSTDAATTTGCEREREREIFSFDGRERKTEDL